MTPIVTHLNPIARIVKKERPVKKFLKKILVKLTTMIKKKVLHRNVCLQEKLSSKKTIVLVLIIIMEIIIIV